MDLTLRKLLVSVAVLVPTLCLGLTRNATASALCDPLQPTTCTIGELADQLGIRFGSTLEDFEITDSNYTTVLLREFTAVTPENSLKWYTNQPSRGQWEFGAGDAVVNFAVESGLEIRGHVPVWSQDTYTPGWVKNITDPVDLLDVTIEHVTKVMTRYADRIDRWDVVNEPLLTFGTSRSASVYWTLGEDWIGDVFRLARTLDPDAELWINEFGSDWVPGKHEAFLALVTRLVESGVPIDGVGVQTHRLPGAVLDQELFESQLRDFTALNLEVAVTELDVPVVPGDPNAFSRQAEEYRKVVAACLAVAGCTEITIWGITDSDTWLDRLGYFATPTQPLLFDDDFAEKPAYISIRNLLAETLADRRLPETGSNPVEMIGIAIVLIAIGGSIQRRFSRRVTRMSAR